MLEIAKLNDVPGTVLGIAIGINFWEILFYTFISAQIWKSILVLILFENNFGIFNKQKKSCWKLPHGVLFWKQFWAQKFEISSCVLKLATTNFGTRNEKMWSQKFVWLALEKGLAQKFVIQKSFHFLRRQANYFYIRWIYFGTI